MSRFSIARLLAMVVVASLVACAKKEPAPEPAAAAAAPAPVAEAPSPPVRKNIHAFTIGAFSAVSLRDGGIEVPNDNKTFAVGHTSEDVADLLSTAGLLKDKLSLDIDPLLVKAGDRVLLFDTGAGANFGPGAGQLASSLAEAGVDAGSVTDIFISHVHGDHVGGLVSADGKLNFPNATIHISKPEWKFLTTVPADMANKMGLATRDAMVAAMKPKVDAFAPGAALVPGVVEAVKIDGHTPGHSGYRITSGADSILYVGDAVHHYVVSVQQPGWTIAFDHDSKTAEASRAQLIADSAASGQRIYAVHFPFPGIGKFEKRDAGYVWVAE